MGHELIQSFRHTARRLIHARGFAIAAILTLALGLGATTTMFSVVYAVLLRPLPYPNPDRIVSLSHGLVVGQPFQVEQSDATLLFYRRHNRTFTHLAGYQASAAAVAPIGEADAERVPAGRITADLFPLLRVTPLRGRLFSDADDRPNAPPVVVMGERLWQRKYGGDAGILNRHVQIDGVPHEVIGIVPAVVRFPASDTQLWLPLRLDAAKTEAATFDFQAVGRLRDGISIEAASVDLQGLLLRVEEEFPGRLTRTSIEQTRMRAIVRPLADVLVGDIGRLLWVVLTAAAFVLAIACANVANLFLVRAESRRESLAIQRALGASPGVLLTESFVEGVLVAAIGGGLGVAAAQGAIQVLRSGRIGVDLPRLAELNIDPAVLSVAALCTALTALCVGAVPAVRALGASISTAGSRSATAGRDRHRLRHLLVAAQVALALILLAGSGLMARSVWRLRSVQPGFNASGALSFRVALPPAAYRDADALVRFLVDVEDGIRAIPSVISAGIVSKLPLDEQGRADSAVFLEDRPLQPGSLPGIHPVSYVTDGYFKSAGIAFIEGRGFARPDPPRVLQEAIVSRAFAERYWGRESPIGKRVRIFFKGPWYTIVGVVGSVKDTALDRGDDQTLYCPLLPAREDPRWTPRDVAVVVRTIGSSASVSRPIRDAVRRLDSSVPIYRLRAMTDLVAQAAARRTITLLLIGCASLVALLLGAIGVYGVMSYVVTLRMREIGVRLALGARPATIGRMVSGQALAVAVCGIAAGVAAATVLMRFLSTLLFEVSPTDPVILTLAAMFLLTLVAAASWLPARRAAGADPAQILRAE